MDKPRDVEELMGRSYVTQLHERDGTFYLHVPDLRFIVEGKTLAEAYDRLAARKREYFEHQLTLNGGRDVPEPQDTAARTDLRNAIRPFLIKSAVVAFVGAFLIVVANMSFVYVVEQAPKTIAKKVGRVLLEDGLRYMTAFAGREVSAEKEAEIHAALRGAVAKLQPYTQDLRPLFDCAKEPNG